MWPSLELPGLPRDEDGHNAPPFLTPLIWCLAGDQIGYTGVLSAHFPHKFLCCLLGGPILRRLSVHPIFKEVLHHQLYLSEVARALERLPFPTSQRFRCVNCIHGPKHTAWLKSIPTGANYISRSLEP